MTFKEYVEKINNTTPIEYREPFCPFNGGGYCNDAYYHSEECLKCKCAKEAYEEEMP